MKPHMLKGLVVDEISLVDSPANPGALHILFKREGHTMPTAEELAEIERRKALAAPGALDRLLIKLGITKRDKVTVDPETYVSAASEKLTEATKALAKSIGEINHDASITDKEAAIAKSMGEFLSFTSDATGEQIEKAMRDVALLKAGKDDPSMPSDAETIAALTKQLADKEAELVKAKAAADDPDAGDDAAEAKKKKDAALAAAAYKKALEANGGSVELTKARGEISDLQKRLASFEAERELETFRKRALAIGVAEAQAETIMKASKGDAESFAKVLEMLKGATTAARVGGIFKEFGGASGGANDGSALAEIEAKAEVLTKSDPKLSIIAARVQVRKSDIALAQRERDEERARVRAVS
jgi:hypothetical protein